MICLVPETPPNKAHSLPESRSRVEPWPRRPQRGRRSYPLRSGHAATRRLRKRKSRNGFAGNASGNGQSLLEVVLASWRQAAQEWRRLAGIWAAAMASYHCVRAAGSQRAITEPVRLGAEWACGTPTGESVAFQLSRAVHHTGRAWGAEPDAWRECQWQWHAVENRGELPPAPAAREPWRDFENLSVVLGQLHGSSAPRLDGTVGQLFTST